MKYNNYYQIKKTSTIIRSWTFLLLFLLSAGFLFATPANNCEVVFSFKVSPTLFSGNQTKVDFKNFSLGSFTNATWDFGDGNFKESMSEKVEHIYEVGGSYQVTLTIWDEDGTCNEQETKNITIGGGVTNLCDVSDCVLPGNTNDDDKADLSDLINLASGFGETGPARQNATSDWIPQPSPDWPNETSSGINFKHLDCNGDGTINEMDLMPILFNYTPMETGIVDIEEGGPRVYLQPDVDTIFINETSPEYITINAELIIGDSETPIDDIYSMTAEISFDSSFVKQAQGIHVNFNENSFVAEDETTFKYAQPLRNFEQVDLAMTRTSGSSISGNGRVVSLAFIIIVDIIGGRTDDALSFDLPITGIQILDENGTAIDIALDEDPASVVFINTETTSTNNPELAAKIKVYPNPVVDELTIHLGDLTGEQIKLFDVVGRQIYQEKMSSSQSVLNTTKFNQGLYLLEVTTNEGTLTKRIIIQ